MGIALSGSTQYLYYALIDDSMKVNEGGGNAHEGEFIEKVYYLFLHIKFLQKFYRGDFTEFRYLSILKKRNH